MERQIRRKIKGWLFNKKSPEITPDEVFLDSSNLPEFDTDQFEGRLEKPISKRTLVFLFSFFVIFSAILFSRLFILQVAEGEDYFAVSENNRLKHNFIFSNRGVIYDRNGEELVANVSSKEDFSKRKYISAPGFSHILGYVNYPTKDTSGFYWETSFIGKDGVEKTYSDVLLGENGLEIIEIDALSNVRSQGITKPPKDGKNLTLSIDARIQEKLFEIISETSDNYNYQGGAGAIMDIETGELLALTSFPEYDSNVLSEGEDREKIQNYINDPKKPFLNRITDGLYAPGSVIKPFVAAAALNEGIIDPAKQIYSSGKLTVPNPYFPELSSVFTDWKAHGYVNMIDALAVSSNIYFYNIGGGFGDQKGLGISKIDKYLSDFGLGETTGIDLPSEAKGTIPSPEWKKEVFDGDEWRLGDTYNTSIGQYGVQIAPIQMLRAIASLANGGKLLKPTVVMNNEPTFETIKITDYAFDIVRQGMREAVKRGTASGLNVPYLEVAAKTGTAEIGKIYLNSWVTGFFPYQKPRFAFVVIMDRGPRGNTTGGVYVMRQLLDWMVNNTPKYFEPG